MPSIIQEGRPQQHSRQDSGAAAPHPAEPIDNRCSSIAVPLVVDLDGTLLRTDLLQESVIRLIKRRPARLFLLPLWLLKGRRYLKYRVFNETRLDTDVLPINEQLVAWLREERRGGRRIVLATASARHLAEETVGAMCLFDHVLGSTMDRDLSGSEKVAAIKEHCGPTFDYVGNSGADQPVWEASRNAILVNVSRSDEVAARKVGNVTRVISSRRATVRAAVSSLRLYQSVKNTLVFVPALTSHQILTWPILSKSVIAFLAFGLCASGMYVANDLLDLEEDRRHPTKRTRVLPSGECSIPAGMVAGGSCLLAGLVLGFLSGKLLWMLLLYIIVTSCYTLRWKGLFLVDVFTLAFLYTLRVVAGHLVTGIAFSMWLLSFSFFLFLSLAFSKRAAELIALTREGGQSVPGRGYTLCDLQALTIAGICSGFVSCLVFALYLNSDGVRLLYQRPAILWGILPLLLYYVLRLWMVCARGQLNMDPILYSASSKSTYYIGIAILLLIIAATVKY